MAWIKTQPCIVCREEGHLSHDVECHHIVNGYRLGDMFCLPLCVYHHRGDGGFSGKDRNESWDKSLDNQLRLREIVWEDLEETPPPYVSKRANTQFNDKWNDK